MTSPDVFTSQRGQTLQSKSQLTASFPMSLSAHTSLLTAGSFSQHFQIQKNLLLCQILMHSQGLTSAGKIQPDLWCRFEAYLCSCESLLPCHLGEVSSQTHGRSLFLKAPTARPVCSMKTQRGVTLWNHYNNQELHLCLWKKKTAFRFLVSLLGTQRHISHSVHLILQPFEMKLFQSIVNWLVIVFKQQIL